MITERMVCSKCGSYHDIGLVEEMSGGKTISRHFWCDTCNIDLVFELKPYDAKTDTLIR